MDANPFFSIIIPTCNRAGFIATAIESVLNQEYTYWELIIVDDGSTDNTSEIVHSFKDTRIKYHYQENKELNAARNKGVSLSSGMFICFLDDDDYFLPHFLKDLNCTIADHHSQIGLYRTGVILKSESEEFPLALYDEKVHKNPTNFLLHCHCNLLGAAIHRKIFEELQFHEKFLLFEDLHFLVRVSLKYPFFQVPSHAAVYVRHAETRINHYYVEKEKIDNCMACIDDLFSGYGTEIKRKAGKNIHSTTVSSNYLMFSDKFMKKRDWRGTFYYWWKAVKNVRYLCRIKAHFFHLLKILIYLTGIKK